MRNWRCVLTVLFACLSPAAAICARADDANFLTNPIVTVVRHAPFARGGWKDLLDDDPKTTCQLRCQDGVAEVVLKFGQIGAVESWRVEASPKAGRIRAELLGSALSDKTGFSVLRSDIVDNKTSSKRFSFQPQGVRFLMLRFRSLEQSDLIELRDLFVQGDANPPSTKYEFSESPAKALDVLSKLQKSNELQIRVTEDEAKMFRDARDGSLEDWTLAEAALLASGVTEKAEREKHLTKIAEWEAQAREATASAKNSFQRGDALLKWLHRDEGPLSGGYESRQTRLDVLLTSKKFNCVSSAVIFNILASRLAIDARAVEVPDHAFSIVYHGADHADVETTNAVGFNPARDRAAQREFEKQTGLQYIPDSHRDKRREINDTGLVAIIYYNRGVTMTERNQHHAALLAYFCAMSMDQEFNSAVKNALAGLVNWGNELMDQAQFEQATRVIATGLALAPMDASLKHNQEVAFGKWALSLTDDGNFDQALSVLRRANKRMPDREFVALQAGIFTREGEFQIERNQWQAALELADAALRKVDREARPRIQEWRQGVLLRWANDRLEAKDFAKSVDLLSKSVAFDSKDARATNNLAYSIQQWASHVQQTKGDAQARDLLLALKNRFGTREEVAKVASNFARNTYIRLRDKKQFQQATSSIEENRQLLEPEESRRLLVDSFQAWSGRHIQEKQWEHAVDALEAGLKKFPNESRFQQNLAYCVQSWASASHEAKKDKKTRLLLLELKTRFHGHSRVARAMEAFLHSLVSKAFQQENESAGAWAVLESYRGVLPPDRETNLARIIADQAASQQRKLKKWREALAVYDEGLKRYPDDRHLQNNCIATWHAWAKLSIDREDWKAAIQVYEMARKRFPEEGSFKQNLAYCRHKADADDQN